MYNYSYWLLDDDNIDTLALHTLTKSDVEMLKKECNNLHELLLPENEVKFTEIIGEGTYHVVTTLALS